MWSQPSRQRYALFQIREGDLAMMALMACKANGNEHEGKTCVSQHTRLRARKKYVPCGMMCFYTQKYGYTFCFRFYNTE